MRYLFDLHKAFAFCKQQIGSKKMESAWTPVMETFLLSKISKCHLKQSNVWSLHYKYSSSH